MDKNITEIQRYWSFNGESSEIDDTVTLREMAYTDVDYLIKIIKVQREELTSWRNEFMGI